MTRNLTAALALLAVSAAALATTPASADGAWSRSGGGVGPYGRTWNSSGSGQCDGGHCSSHQQATGPNGGKWTRSGNTDCAGGTCSRNATVTGPDGGTRSRSATWSRH
jgi:hypothetical protein